jgi:hypothetical protein
MDALAHHPTAQAWCGDTWPRWSGVAFLGSHPLAGPWLGRELRDFGLDRPSQLAVFVPGPVAPHMPRGEVVTWPVDNLSRLMEEETGAGLIPVESLSWLAGPLPWSLALKKLEGGSATVATSDSGLTVHRDDLSRGRPRWARPAVEFRWTLC